MLRATLQYSEKHFYYTHRRSKIETLRHIEAMISLCCSNCHYFFLSFLPLLPVLLSFLLLGLTFVSKKDQVYREPRNIIWFSRILFVFENEPTFL